MSGPNNEYCENCRFWLEYDEDGGFCRRFPPECVVVDDDLHALQPKVMHRDWCGEHQAVSA